MEKEGGGEPWDLQAEERAAGLELGWAGLGCSWSQLGQRVFIWFLINQRKCLDQMWPLLLDCLPRVGPGLGWGGSLTRDVLGQISASN